MLALHLLQSALVFVNTLLIQRILTEDGWANASPPPTNAPWPRCSGPTSTFTDASTST